MDQETWSYYSRHAQELSKKYDAAEAGISRYFSQAFDPSASVLDVGCGSGRDLSILISQGYEAVGIDACTELLDAGSSLYPNLQDKLSQDALPELKGVDDGAVDGIVCSAVLMHIPKEELFDSAYTIRRILRPKGRLLISIPLFLSKDAVTHRDTDGRLFNGVTPEQLQLLFERIGFKLISRWDNDDSLGREDRAWATLLFTLESHDGIRGLDQIESILNKDKKDATYKLALFRALVEIAMTNYNSVRWLPSGKVALPLRWICEKWIEYYWPLFESDRFIPQKYGEKPGGQKCLAFRGPLTELISAYKDTGGLPSFKMDYRNESIRPEIKPLLSPLFSKLRTAIKNGPVYYAGGGGSQTFEYDTASKSVLVSSSMWRELSLMGSWIADATLLRWAEFTSEVSENEFRTSEVLDFLLMSADPTRDVSVARRFYERLPQKVCVWSDQQLKSDFDVDHAIPFSLWRNNDLWNLLPADPKQNNKKRDKLPSKNLLIARKDYVIDYWKQMRSAYEMRFDREAIKFSGAEALRRANWENSLYAAFSEAIEMTALQRGVDRWAPS